ncbi:MAG: hypothetical protein B7Y56_05255 [Gallionellales bacterium 35-53-114]|jgi:hypothetical protein|nr:MAG: hypothetical protein B7Y56_05255 [Gallionellales bacterium 35-53-114]OYZ62592.1 MAG: hypothetical protein B7Y04_11955 [Gallionellales bacterium 24-53-125]OZB09550.1 MAG: hypothetical protein B7X61_07845 [Gallionellales bacterium 39-52-133]HQS57780.1 DUF1415 domain-containing protein [Gallionellaceae bacterium]HQS74233.1 DUF1415 domain-containing protein [Gallionellaceae bacterium]
MNKESNDDIIAATQRWLERAVIGLNLCPFAKAVHVKKQIRYVVSSASTPEDLLKELINELELLAETSSEKIDTTLLIHPHVLTDFLDYNDFLDIADETLEELDLAGELQIASMHPQYQFADTQPDDMENYTNRSPYPTLHLLRESSVDKAVAAFPEADQIFEKNIATMKKLGHEGWNKLWLNAANDAGYAKNPDES